MLAGKIVNFLALLPWNRAGIKHNFNGFFLIDVHRNATLSDFLRAVGRVLSVTAVAVIKASCFQN